MLIPTSVELYVSSKRRFCNVCISILDSHFLSALSRVTNAPLILRRVTMWKNLIVFGSHKPRWKLIVQNRGSNGVGFNVVFKVPGPGTCRSRLCCNKFSWRSGASRRRHKHRTTRVMAAEEQLEDENGTRVGRTEQVWKCQRRRKVPL